MGNGDNKDQVSVREVATLSANVKSMNDTMGGMQTDMKDGFQSIHDTMNGLVSQEQLVEVDKKVEKCHKRISGHFWKILVIIMTLATGAVGWVVKHLTMSPP